MTELEKKLWNKSQKYIKFLRIVPFVRMISVCNNLAFGKVNEESDIDLFVICKRGRMFTARILITSILHLLTVRRHGRKVAQRFCLSFFVDDSHLDLSKIALQDDIYLAYWIKSMKPVLDDGVSTEFVSSNSWINRFFDDPNVSLSAEYKVKNKSFIRAFLEFLFLGKIGDFIEKRLKKWQLSRAREKVGLAGEEASLIVEEHILKFHNIDRRREYRNKWFQNYGEEVKVEDEKFLLL